MWKSNGCLPKGGLAKETQSNRKYSKGELNRMIASVFHPLFSRGGAFMGVDTVLHSLVEQNPPESVKKFVRYSLLKIVEEIIKSH